MNEDHGELFSTRFLQPADLAQLAGLVFAPRRRPMGRFVGRHASPQIGHAAEFNDYRAYAPGDSVADIDWKVYGRTDRLFIKRFEQQTDLHVGILIDASASMAYEGGDPDTRKYDVACHLASALAAVVLQQGDTVTLGFAQDGLCEVHRRVGHLSLLPPCLQTMARLRPARRADLPAAVAQFHALLPPRSAVVILSDLLDVDDPLPPLSRHRAAGGEAMLWQVLHPHELQLPTHQATMYVDSETGARLPVASPAVRERYAACVQKFIADWRQRAHHAGAGYRLFAEPSATMAQLRGELTNRLAAAPRGSR